MSDEEIDAAVQNVLDSLDAPGEAPVKKPGKAGTAGRRKAAKTKDN